MAIVVVDVKGFMSAWSTIQNNMDAAGANAFRVCVKQAWGAQKEHGYQNRTGKLTASMRWRTWQPKPFGYHGEVKSTAPYAKFVDMGTRPHTIRGRNGGMLHFYWPKVGRWMTVRQVHHPGFKGAAFSAAAIQTFGQTAPAVIEQALGQAANR